MLERSRIKSEGLIYIVTINLDSWLLILPRCVNLLSGDLLGVTFNFVSIVAKFSIQNAVATVHGFERLSFALCLHY